MTRLLEIETAPAENFPARHPAQDQRHISVAHVVLSLEIGGLERVVVDLARQGKCLGQKVSILCLERTGALADEARNSGARIECLKKSPGIRLGLIRDIAAKLRELQPDVVHTHQVGAMFYCSRTVRHANAPILVHTEHGKHYASRFRTRMLGRLASGKIDRFFCVSKDIALEVRRCRIVDPAKLVILHNGIDVARFRPRSDDSLRIQFNIPPRSPLIGTVGRLCEIKQQQILLRAFAELGRPFPSAHLLLVGDGPLRPELEKLADDLGIAPRIHFAGYQPEPEKFLAMMDIFALTSRSEGMPLSVLEAWASGVPVVASAVGGLPEMIGSTGAGALFPAGDAAALASRLSDLLAHEDARMSMGTRGRDVVRNSYSVQRMTEEYQRHYLALLNRKSTGQTNHAYSGHH
jgi:glycosyltransferase involved in cell wall biosynthesis